MGGALLFSNAQRQPFTSYFKVPPLEAFLFLKFRARSRPRPPAAPARPQPGRGGRVGGEAAARTRSRRGARRSTRAILPSWRYYSSAWCTI